MVDFYVNWRHWSDIWSKFKNNPTYNTKYQCFTICKVADFVYICDR